jgi:SWI/SNF-related matrix-associated actin-dependent regulator 1 of chromatin subfamily A
MRYCGARRCPWGMDYRGATRLGELNELLTAGVMIRRRKQDVLSQLPAKARHVLTLSMSRPQEYAEAGRNFSRWLRAVGPARAASAERAEGLAKLGYLRRLAARLKMRGVFEFVDNFLAGGEKLIVFAVHKKCVELLENRYKGQCAVVTGKVVGRKREQAFAKFNTDERCRVFVGNIKAAGVGWSCTSSRTVCFAEMEWSPGAHAQAEDRVHGLGRGRGGPVSAYYLTAKDTVEEMIFRLIQKKAAVLADAIDGGAALDLDIYDLLLKELGK